MASFTTKAGKTYTLTPYQKATTTWNDVAGVYIFAIKDAKGNFTALYVGQCDSFKNRIPNHERWAEAARKGATIVLAVPVSRQADRDSLESDLIAQLQPPLNTQLR